MKKKKNKIKKENKLNSIMSDSDIKKINFKIFKILNDKFLRQNRRGKEIIRKKKRFNNKKEESSWRTSPSLANISTLEPDPMLVLMKTGDSKMEKILERKREKKKESEWEK